MSHGDVGPSEGEWLLLVEVDARGDRVAMVSFDADDLDAAYAELDARFAADEGAPFAPIRTAMVEFRRAFASRDWPALAAILSPDLQMHDHRPLGWEPSHGPTPYVDELCTLVELAPDVQLRLDHGEMCPRGYLALSTWVGTRDGGVFETPSYIVGELDAAARACRFDQYDLDQLAAARARFTALAAPAPNAATRLRARLLALFNAGDWAGLRALVTPGFIYEDRRRWTQMAGGVELWMQSMQAVRETDIRPVRDPRHARRARRPRARAVARRRRRRPGGGRLARSHRGRRRGAAGGVVQLRPRRSRRRPRRGACAPGRLTTRSRQGREIRSSRWHRCEGCS